MKNILFSGGLALISLCSLAQAGAQADVIASSPHFRLDCSDYQDACDATPDLDGRGRSVVAEMERIRTWFGLLGFAPRDMLLNDGGQEILLTGRQSQDACGASAVACHRIDMSGTMSRLWLPIDTLDAVLDATAALAHEYLHSRQDGTDPEAAEWLREAVATAVGEAWGIVNGRATSIYPPLYRLSLDIPFHYNVMDDLDEDAGYRNWSYLLHLGKQIGSKAQIAYLADDAFMNDRQYGLSRNPAEAMRPFYQAPTIKGASFDRLFPQFVAGFNNLDRYPGGGYYYYKNVNKTSLVTLGTSTYIEESYPGAAAPYAADAVHIALEIGAGDVEALPEDQLMLAEVEIAGGDHLDDLTLVTEHSLGIEQHKTMWLLDGSNSPDELGFFRVVHAPSSFDPDREPAKYDLRARVSPVKITKPVCFRQGLASNFAFEGLDPRVSNWHLTTDNGTVAGLSVIPARTGTANISLEVTGLITRRNGSLDPLKPRKTIISLGNFPVVADDCMIRLRISTMGGGGGHEAILTFSFDGEYTEITSSAGGAIYWSGDDMAIYQGGWVDLPPAVKAVMMPQLMASSGVPKIFAPGEGEIGTDGVFFGRMPHAFSKRFSWSTVQGVMDPDGEPLRRKRISCPDGGSGCSTASILTEGQPAPIIFDAQGRPIRVVMSDGGERATMNFEYGNWPIRRPPGW